MAWDDLPPPDVNKKTTLKEYTRVLPETLKISAKEIIGKPYKAAMKGALSGSTFGMAGGNELEGSILSPEGGLKTKPEKYAETMGKFFGTIPWLAAAEFVAGATMPSIIAKYGIGPVRQAMTNGAITMATFEAMRGGATQQPISQTIGDIGKGALGGTVLGAGGHALGKGREFIGDYIPRKQTNFFLGTPQKMAEKIQEQGKLPLSEQLLQKEPKLHGFKTRKQILDSVSKELDKENYIVETKLSDYQKMSTPEDISMRPFSETPRTQPAINIKEIVNKSVDSLSKQYENTGNIEKSKMIKNWSERFLKNKKDYADLLTSNKIKSDLDNEVGKAYLSGAEAKISPKIDIQMDVANGIRSEISRLAPDVADSLQRQHRLLNIRTSLSPKTAESGATGSIGTLKLPVTGFLGSRENYGLAQALRNIFGKPYPITSGTTKRMSQIGLSKYINRNE